VPVATSALLQIRELTGRKVGVLTASAENLTPAHLEAVGAPGDTPVEGLPRDGAFAATFLRNGLSLDRDAVERETVQAGRSLIARHPSVDTLVLECTNLPPYKQALQQALGLPVFDVLDLLRDFRKRLG
jgi:Asp/Glu/hydantoin racemase